MKISFSTLGCPEWSWEDMLATAKDFGFDGIEVRGIENELYVPKARPFLDSNLIATTSKLHKMGLEIPCLTSSCYLFDKVNIDFYINEGKEYINLACKLGVPFVRVMGDAAPEPGKAIDTGFVAANLSVLAEYASQRKVTVLLETNGVFSNSDTVLGVVNQTNSCGLGVLWDVHHPYRFMNETVEQTYSKLKDYIKFVHIKDSSYENGKVTYKLMGCGDVPVREALLLLKDRGYDGYVSLEWVKRWCMDLEAPGIVFSHYANFVKNIIL